MVYLKILIILLFFPLMGFLLNKTNFHLVRLKERNSFRDLLVSKRFLTVAGILIAVVFSSLYFLVFDPDIMLFFFAIVMPFVTFVILIVTFFMDRSFSYLLFFFVILCVISAIFYSHGSVDYKWWPVVLGFHLMISMVLVSVYTIINILTSCKSNFIYAFLYSSNLIIFFLCCAQARMAL